MSETLGELVARPPIHPANYETLRPDRFDQVFIYYEHNVEHYRYRLTVLDRQMLPTTRLDHATAVVLIPAGRESEYIFSSHHGLQSVAESANCARLVAVAFGRHYEFENQEIVQNELTYVVQALSQQGRFLPRAQYKNNVNNASIPFMALDGVGSRNVLAEGDTTISGRYLVEQVKADDRMVRRLYFMDNPFVIQSEVAMDKLSGIDHQYLAFDYHKHMAAGILSLSNAPSAGLVVGLGGGGLVNFLNCVLPSTNHTVIELDASVVTIAKEYFGFDYSGENVYVRVGNGLAIQALDNEVTNEDGSSQDKILFPPDSLDFLAIDVDSKDNTVGMSCPPLSFVQISFLTKLRSILRPDGLLVMNVSARDPSMLALVKNNVKVVFSSVFVSDENGDEGYRSDVNVVVFAKNTPVTLPTTLQLIDIMQNNLIPFKNGNRQLQPSWESTVSELEECIASIHGMDQEGADKTPLNAKTKKKGNAKRKKGKKK